MGLESLLGEAAGATPYGAIAQGALGLGQVLFSGKRKAERNLEKFAASYKPNAGIVDYYNKALQGYNANPYTSSLYNHQTKTINRNLNFGVDKLQERRLGIGGITSLVQGANDAAQKAAAGAEEQQRQSLGQLGRAAQIKSEEDYKPFEMKYNLLAMKAGAANKTASAGLQNIFGGLQGVQDNQTLNKVYGNGKRTPNYLSYGMGE